MTSRIRESQSLPGTTFHIEGQIYHATLFYSWDSPLFPELAGSSIFLSKAYHKALAEAPPSDMEFMYVRLESENELVGMLCFLISHFNPGESLKKHARKNLFNRLRYKLASLINLKVLCLGNTLVTGDYGFCFHHSISDKMRTLLMMETIDWMLTMPAFRDIRMVFVKDFYDDIFRDLPDSPFCKKYHFIDTQPSMILDIDISWKNLDGYLAALKSKYRIRARKAINVAQTLKKEELDVIQISENEDVLHELYLKVVDDVGFNLFILSKGYFTALKKSLGDQFHVWVYRENDEIISFYTVFEDRDILDAHFLGYDPEVNHHYKLYLNMLLSMIDYAAVKGFRQLQLSRTATEIKSSVGAVGVPMWSYLRIPNKWLNSWVPLAYSFFKPDLGWVERKPFHVTKAVKVTGS
jgi:hypothetical protein